jgi:hypothetical protein
MRHNLFILTATAASLYGCIAVQESDVEKALVYRTGKQIHCTVRQSVACDISSTLGIKYITVTLRTPGVRRKTMRQAYNCVGNAAIQWDPAVAYASIGVETCESPSVASNFAVAVYGKYDMRHVLVGRVDATASLAAAPSSVKHTTWWNCGPHSSSPFLPCDTLQRFCALTGGNFDVHDRPLPSPDPEEPSGTCEIPEWPPEPPEPQ